MDQINEFKNLDKLQTGSYHKRYFPPSRLCTSPAESNYTCKVRLTRAKLL